MLKVKILEILDGSLDSFYKHCGDLGKIIEHPERHTARQPIPVQLCASAKSLFTLSSTTDAESCHSPIEMRDVTGVVIAGVALRWQVSRRGNKNRGRAQGARLCSSAMPLCCRPWTPPGRRLAWRSHTAYRLRGEYSIIRDLDSQVSCWEEECYWSGNSRGFTHRMQFPSHGYREDATSIRVDVERENPGCIENVRTQYDVIKLDGASNLHTLPEFHSLTKRNGL
ncbi:hypothetical protein K438DRAFT_1776431 [Mycena galopus ATCC 62051]|nr:hypothetical protein K438DRAFT_1776431 [Mycena galopus ATCC 62051]